LDANKNGKWDTGFLAGNLQPEEVVYFPKVIKLKSNFEFKESWKIEYKADYIKKNLIDEDLEKENARKKEQAKKSGAKTNE